MQKAWIMAGVKLALGLFFVGTIVGVRVVTVTPASDTASGVDGLGDATREIQRSSEASSAVAESDSDDDSLLGRVTTGLREQLPQGDGASRDGDRMVSCRLRGATQFMTADDCATRGGKSTLFKDDR